MCVWVSLGALAAWPHAAGVAAVTVRASGAAAPAGPRVASRGAPALSELPLLPATPRRLAVSAARRRAARFGAYHQNAAVPRSTPDAATRFVNRLFLPIAMAAATSRARERQRSGAGAT